MKYIKKGFSFLTSPGTSFDNEKTTALSEAFKYILFLTVILAVLGGIVNGIAALYTPNIITGLTTVTLETLPMYIVGSIIGMYLLTIIGFVIWGLWLHLWAYIVGARKGLVQTMKSVFYGGTPNYLLGWIPLISFIAIIWSFVLTGMGIVRYQEMTGGKAALAIIIAILIPILIGVALFLTFIGLFISMLGTVPGGFTVPGY
jgi:hypothetical protein